MNLRPFSLQSTFVDSVSGRVTELEALSLTIHITEREVAALRAMLSLPWERLVSAILTFVAEDEVYNAQLLARMANLAIRRRLVLGRNTSIMQYIVKVPLKNH